MRAVWLCLLATTVTTASAAPTPEAPASPDDAKAVQLLGTIATAPDAAARKAAIAELDELAPRALDAIGSWVVRKHATDVDARKAVLASIDAAVPDKSGKFVAQRESDKDKKGNDDVDWLRQLLPLPASAATGEVIADDVAIRALAASKDIHAAALLFEVAFDAGTMIYRDECGRYLRKMNPWSVPALTRESQQDGDRRRYATFQLERMDRQDAKKALDSATRSEALQIAILDVFRETRHREAVHAVWGKIDDDAPRVRAAARAAWMDYITGPPPKPAPRKKLQMAGGKLTKKEKPLWLTYRELADLELRRASNDLLHTDYSLEDETTIDDSAPTAKIEPIDQVAVTKQLFAFHDGERAKREQGEWSVAKTKAAAGDITGAAAVIDRLIAINPERAERVEMGKIYGALGKQLTDAKRWPEAAAAYSKAAGLDPTSPTVHETLAAGHYAAGQALQAAGKDGGPDFRRAVALKPDYAPAQSAAEAVDHGGPRPAWMLYVAAAAGMLALLLAGAALAIRRRRTA